MATHAITHQRQETPPIIRQTSRWGYVSGSLDLGRTAVMEDLKYIPVVPVSFLLDNVLPKLPASFDPDKVISSLKSAKILNKGVGWASFRKPQNYMGHEDSAFRMVKNIFDGIVNAVKSECEDPPAVVTMKQNPSRAPLSQRANASRPDAILELLERKSVGPLEDGSSNWEDIPVSMEFKKFDSDADRHDNRAKILWSLHHTMRNDPCRRFAFGVTIENTTTRIWFWCRSVVLTSEKFDFSNDRDTVIRTFASFAFANDTDLGFDPTMTRVLIDARPQYEIQVMETTYRTTRVLSDFGADAMVGRGTRVFEVYDVHDLGRTLRALKDVWVEEDRPREGDILENLFRKIRDQSGEVGLKNARKYFLTVVTHGDVVIEDRRDHTKDLIMRGQDLPADGDPISLTIGSLTRQKHSHHSEGPQISSVGHVPGPEENPLRRTTRPLAPPVSFRVHYRVVFEEVGTAVHYVERQSTVWRVLRDAVKALKIMHAYDYVHRDVSTGNILDCGGRGKLSDLEYSKESGDIPVHEVRTGTFYFMAVEVANQDYMFQDETSDDKSDTEDEEDVAEDDEDEDDEDVSEDDKSPATGGGDLAGSGDLAGDGGGDGIQDPLFHYNPLHDIESIWWAANFFLFHRFTIADFDRGSLTAASNTLFPPNSDLMSRYKAFRRGYDKLIDNLPTSFQKHGKEMKRCRKKLVKRYKKAESGPEIDITAFHATIHRHFITMFKAFIKLPGSKLAIVNQLPSDEGPEETVEQGSSTKRRKIYETNAYLR